MTTRGFNTGESPVGEIIRTYRKARGVTQKEFAAQLGVEARTLRMYENGERVLENISDLRRIADLLDIDPREVGLAARTVALDASELQERVRHIASLVQQARLIEARTISEALWQDLNTHDTQADPSFLYALASLHAISAEVQALTRSTREISRAIKHYQEMATLAGTLEDQALLALTLANQADLARRRGDVTRALEGLDEARALCPLAYSAVLGTIALLTGRAHMTRGEAEPFAEEMAKALAYAQELDGNESMHIWLPFAPGMVYLEYARGYGLQGKLEQSQHYAELAEMHLPANNLWTLLLKATRAEALVHADDIPGAMPRLTEVAHLAQMYSHQLLIERLHRLHYHLEDRISLLRKASRALNEILLGPIEQ